MVFLLWNLVKQCKLALKKLHNLLHNLPSKRGTIFVFARYQMACVESEGRNIKLRYYRVPISCKQQFWSRGQITSRINYKLSFQRKKTLTLDTDEKTFNRYNANGHSQTGNRKKISKQNSKDKSKNKSNKTLFTHHCVLNIYLQKLPFILDLKTTSHRLLYKFN